MERTFEKVSDRIPAPLEEMLCVEQLASLLVLLCAALVQARSQTTPQPKEGDFVLHDFHFRSGETLPELRCTTRRSLLKSTS